MRRLALIVGSLVTGCVSVPPDSELEPVGEPRQLHVAAVNNRPVSVEFSAGELAITGSETDTIDAELKIRCPRGKTRCVTRAEKMALRSVSEADGLRVEVENAGALGRRGAAVEMLVNIPAASDLDVKFGYGDLQIRNVSGCVTVDMNAGSASLLLPLESVGSVFLDAGTGDAIMRIDDSVFEGERRWLVGAEVDWKEGSGPCHTLVDVNAGDVSLRLD